MHTLKSEDNSSREALSISMEARASMLIELRQAVSSGILSIGTKKFTKNSFSSFCVSISKPAQSNLQNFPEFELHWIQPVTAIPQE